MPLAQCLREYWKEGAGRRMDTAVSMDTIADTTFYQECTYSGIRNTAVSMVSSILRYRSRASMCILVFVCGYSDTHLGVSLPVDVSFRDAPNAVPSPTFAP